MSTATARPLGRAIPRPQPRHTPLRVVPAAISSSGKGVFASLCIVLLGIGLIVLLLLHAQLAAGSYTLHDLEATSGTLADQQHELTRAIDAERNPAALAAKAQAMGMVPANSMAFIRLSDGTILGAADPATDKPLVIVTTPKAPPPAPVVSADPAAAADPAGTSPADPAATAPAATPAATAGAR